MNYSFQPGPNLAFERNFLSSQITQTPEIPKIRVEAVRKTNSLLIAITVTLFVVFFILLVYLGWLWYVRDTNEDANTFYKWLV